jgi:glycosyltransferase involved in cell wall biosynthesis
VADLEDISVPKREDWVSKTETNRLQQVIFWLCLKALGAVVTGNLLPTRRFLPFVRKEVPAVIVHGSCCNERTTPALLDYQPGTRPLSVIFCGKLTSDHGFDLFTAAIRICNTGLGLRDRLAFHLTGGPETALDLVRNEPNVTCHGSVSDAEYCRVLEASDVGVSLQKSSGRYASFKTPSKAYEFLCFGKLVLSTNVGDLDELAGRCVVLVEPETPERIADLLREIVLEPGKYKAIVQNAIGYCANNLTPVSVGQRLMPLLKVTD